MSKQTRRTENGIVNDADPKTVKRAQWESFSFELEAPGLIRVINGSHENPEEHSYRVNVENGEPVACECKSFQYNDGPCKHAVAVAIREPVLQAAQSVPVTDGGEVTDTCQNGEEGCQGPHGDKLPCFECYQEASR